MEPCVSCIYLTYCMEYVGHLHYEACENLPYESVYFEEL